jgi:hypothetical protein
MYAILGSIAMYAMAVSTELTTMLTDGFGGLVSDLLTVLAIAVPSVFAVIGTFFVIRKVIGFFQKSTSKS